MGVYLSEINMPKDEGSKLVLQIFPNGEVYDEHGIRLGITNWAEAVPVQKHWCEQIPLPQPPKEG